MVAARDSQHSTERGFLIGVCLSALPQSGPMELFFLVDSDENLAACLAAEYTEPSQSLAPANGTAVPADGNGAFDCAVVPAALARPGIQDVDSVETEDAAAVDTV